MKSNICKIEKGSRDLDAILKESENVASYNGFTHKQTLQLRLLCEELDGMLPNIVNDFDGDFWIEYEDGVCKVNASIKIPELTASKKEDLIQVAKNKKNAASVGIVGKIRDAIENMFLNEEFTGFMDVSTGIGYFPVGDCANLNYSHLWSLNQYKVSVKDGEQKDAWDELEKSIIASLADDVIVGVKGKRADIIITKKFA